MISEKPFILLAEDNEDDIMLTLRVFKKHHLANEVVVVKHGAEALDFLFAKGQYAGRDATKLPQVVLLDINMPKLNGIEVLKAMREDERTRLLPVVMLTTSQEDRDIIESYENGASSYVRKPVDFAEFTHALQALGVYWLLLNTPPPPPGGDVEP